MGWCRDFGSQIAEGCDHPMQAGSDSCHCEHCGAVCTGKFEACPSVWALGPQPVIVTLTSSDKVLDGPSFESLVSNGRHSHDEVAASPSSDAPDIAAPAADTPPMNSGDSGTEVFRWFQNAFDALRLEVEGLRGALSQEQSLVASLVQSQATERDVDLEALGELVATAVRMAVRREAAALKTELAAAIDTVRQDVHALAQSQDDGVAGLRDSMAAAAANLETMEQGHAERLAGLEASVAAATAGLPAELSRRDSGNRKAFRSTLHDELEPLVEVVAESVAQSEYQLQAIDRKLDGVTELGEALSAALAAVTDYLDDLTGDDNEVAAPQQRSNGRVARPGSPPAPRAGVEVSTSAPSSRAVRAASGKRVSLRTPPAEG